ncbi:MAG: hypothetical protein KME46_33595 [Brasilonema angustatum HA4187-MV1]|jgi:predicted DNA binding CopG/RHH family protein|nr:hypothetical protein [Brasilonema angustatum HA4187-MV1]
MPEIKRINYNVPVDLVEHIHLFAAEDGANVRYWLRKVLEKAINERLTKSAS